MAWTIRGNANKSNNRGSKGSTGNKSSGSSSGGSSGSSGKTLNSVNKAASGSSGSRGSGSLGGFIGSALGSLGSMIAGSIRNSGSGSSGGSRGSGSSGSSSGSSRGSGSSSSSGGSGSKKLNNINKALKSAPSSGRSTLGSTLAGLYGGATGSTGSPLSYVSRGTHGDQTIKDMSEEDTEKRNRYKQMWAEANARGDQAGMDEAHRLAEALRNEYGDSGGTAGSDYLSHGGYYAGRVMGDQMTKQLDNAYANYQEQMNQAAEAQQNAIRAGVDSAVAGLEGQKYGVDKQTELNNAAAEKAYMQSINPNGSVAENLAASGLLPTGATETSQISAGNTFQNALNSNATTRTEALAQIEQAITQARLNGDLQAAQALSNLLQTVAAKGYENVQNILAAQQWGQQFGLSQADQTGTYNGQPTMAMRQLQMQQRQVEQDLEAGRIDMETARKQLEYLQAQIDGLNAETAGQQLQNKYYQSQLG